MPLWKLTLKKIMESYFLENVVLCVQFFSGRDYLSRRVETTYPGGLRLPIQAGWDYLSRRVETTYPDGSRLPIQTVSAPLQFWARGPLLFAFTRR